jgi:hypothetical protein
VTGNRIAIVTDRPMDVVEAHGPSANAVTMTGVTAEYSPPAPAMGREGRHVPGDRSASTAAPAPKGVRRWRRW